MHIVSSLYIALLGAHIVIATAKTGAQLNYAQGLEFEIIVTIHIVEMRMNENIMYLETCEPKWAQC